MRKIIIRIIDTVLDIANVGFYIARGLYTLAKDISKAIMKLVRFYYEGLKAVFKLY